MYKKMSIEEEEIILEKKEDIFDKITKIFFLILIIGFYLILNLAMLFKLIELIFLKFFK
jgi:hypothetical protein